MSLYVSVCMCADGLSVLGWVRCGSSGRCYRSHHTTDTAGSAVSHMFLLLVCSVSTNHHFFISVQLTTDLLCSLLIGRITGFARLFLRLSVCLPSVCLSVCLSVMSHPDCQLENLMAQNNQNWRGRYPRGKGEGEGVRDSWCGSFLTNSFA